jgi:hypothetical protein
MIRQDISTMTPEEFEEVFDLVGETPEDMGIEADEWVEELDD